MAPKALSEKPARSQQDEQGGRMSQKHYADQEAKIQMPHLVGTSTAKHFHACPEHLFDVHRKSMEISLSFHFEEHLECFHTLLRAIRRTWEDTPPDYMTGDGSSHMVQAIPYTEYCKYFPAQLGEILKTNAILLTGLPVQADGFESAMRGLNRLLDTSIICNNQSIEMGPNAATPSTWHHLHVNTNGFGMTAMLTFGKKLWALLRRKGDPSTSRPIDWSDTLDSVNKKVLDSEEYKALYAILEPGTTLMMPGGCPHMVFTLDDSTVFSSSHFYHGQCLQHHMFNLIIMAALLDSMNTTHNECAISIIGNVLEMIRKACLKPEAIPDSMWSHLPDVRTEEGMKETLVLCVMVRLLPVIFHTLQESKEDLHTISNDTLKLAKQIKASERHQFSMLACRDLDFFYDVYKYICQYVGYG
ncbi:hypothetical protein BDN71DRAFT_1513698 [Pleurotus eryngii]|uniref:JmjC domain-containing protein n=1 Tax=Pleurotus eryngii TaxID=5323 RepID=A0A9P5ZHA9_PLEER|nr:hypothetical protein BDN71DRAFT_1513698 [Pleurotus eryngii]